MRAMKKLKYHFYHALSLKPGRHRVAPSCIKWWSFPDLRRASCCQFCEENNKNPYLVIIWLGRTYSARVDERGGDDGICQTYSPALCGGAMPSGNRVSQGRELEIARPVATARVRPRGEIVYLHTALPHLIFAKYCGLFNVVWVNFLTIWHHDWLQVSIHYILTVSAEWGLPSSSFCSEHHIPSCLAVPKPLVGRAWMFQN